MDYFAVFDKFPRGGGDYGSVIRGGTIIRRGTGGRGGEAGIGGSVINPGPDTERAVVRIASEEFPVNLHIHRGRERQEHIGIVGVPTVYRAARNQQGD